MKEPYRSVFSEAEGPFVWFLGWVLVLAVVGGTTVGVVHAVGDSAAEICAAEGGYYEKTEERTESGTVTGKNETCTPEGERP